MKFPQALNIPDHARPQIQQELLKLGRHYGVAINQMSKRTDTHDMGFIVQPALQKDWELTGNQESLQSVINAAYALASRYDERVKAIRSWDVAINDRYSITDMDTNFLVIIDSMCSTPSPFSFSFHTLPTLSLTPTTISPSNPLLTSPHRPRPPLPRLSPNLRPHPLPNRHIPRPLHHNANPPPRLLLLPPRQLLPHHRLAPGENDQPRLVRRLHVVSRTGLGNFGLRADLRLDERRAFLNDGCGMRGVLPPPDA